MTRSQQIIGAVLGLLLVLVGVFIGHRTSSPAPTPGEDLGGGIINQLPGLYPNGIQIGDTTFNVATIRMTAAAKQAQGSWKAPKDVIIDKVELVTNGTATSTYFANAATSTSATVSTDTYFAFPSILNRVEISTGTPAFVYNSQSQVGTTSPTQGNEDNSPYGFATSTPFKVGLLTRLGATPTGAGISGAGGVRVSQGTYVNFNLIAPISSCEGNRAPIGGGHGRISCAPANATDRGFDMDFRIFYHY